MSAIRCERSSFNNVVYNWKDRSTDRELVLPMSTLPHGLWIARFEGDNLRQVRMFGGAARP